MEQKYVLDELPMIQGWLHWSWSMLNDPLNRLSGVTIDGKGFVRLEEDRLMAMLQ